MRTSRVWILLPIMLVAGCSTFDQRWKSTPAAKPGFSWLLGRWEGTWTSKAGHGEGALRAVVVPGKTSDSFSATFKATYWGVLTAEYSVDMTAREQADGRITFHGTKDLGAMAGGVYTYDGWANAERFESTYTSKGDSGTFQLTRAR